MNTPIDPDLLEYLRKQSNNNVVEEKELNKIRNNRNFNTKNNCDLPLPLASVDDVFIPVVNDKIKIRIYNPLKDQILPVLIFIHGGGWFAGNIDTHDVFCRKIAKFARCLVVSTDYRLAPENNYPTALVDCCEACSWVKKYIKDYSGDPSNIALCGDSSGGNLTAALSQMLTVKDLPIFKFHFLIYPVTNLSSLNTESYQLFKEGCGLTKEDMEWFIKLYLKDSKEAYHPSVSPLLSNNFSRVPDTYIITAGHDILEDEANAYAEKLKAAGISVIQKCYEDMIHGFIVMDGISDRAKEIIKEMGEVIYFAFKKQEN
jgi:acetyl esterase/lipase